MRCACTSLGGCASVATSCFRDLNVNRNSVIVLVLGHHCRF